MSVAVLFPGQGTELGELAGALDDVAGHGRALLAAASEALQLDVPRLLKRGGSQLGRTEVLQPVLTAASLAVVATLRERGVGFDWVLGHSLGEIGALAAAGYLSDGAAVAVAATRGRAMAREAARLDGGMLAVTGVDASRVQALLTLGQPHGEVALAAHNAPDEWVLSGSRAALQAIAARADGRWLAVEGPWHSHAMAGAMPELRAALEQRGGGALRARFVCNRTGTEALPGEDLVALLTEQLVRPIEWVRAVDTLANGGVDQYVIVGPGRVLRGLLRKCLGPDAAITIVARTEDVDRLCATTLPSAARSA